MKLRRAPFGETIFASRLVALLVVLGLGITGAQAILGPALPCSDDIGFHLFRLMQLDYLVERGILYSRWAPDMVLGYGYPIFNYVPPLPYYVALALSRLGLGVNIGLRFTLALGLWASGWAAYCLARDHFSAPASLVAAVAYMYAPYQGYDALFRGNLSESFAWFLLPLTLWAVGRLARTGGRGWLVIGVMSYAAILLTHNIFTLLTSPLVGAYAIWSAWSATGSFKASARIRRIVITLGVLAGGMGLAAFFWIPAFFERHLVQIERLVFGFPFAFWNHFLSLREMLLAVRGVTLDLRNPSPPRTLGLIPVLIGIPGLWGLWRFDDRRRRLPLAFFAVALCGYGFLMTAHARFIWEHVPLLKLVEFPWRMLAPAALCLSFLSAATVDLLRKGWLRTAVAGGAIVALILGGLYWFHPRYCYGYEHPTLTDLHIYEQRTGQLGTTSAGEYLPKTVSSLPERPADQPFDIQSLPTGVEIREVRVRPLETAALIETSRPVRLVVHRFDFPGWRAWIDGEPVDIEPTDPQGMISVTVPGGEHRLVVRFGPTPLRTFSTVLSLLSLVVLVMLVRHGPDVPAKSRPLERGLLSWWLLVPLGIIVLKEGLIDAVESPLQRHRLTETGLRGVGVPRDVLFDRQFRLLGHDALAREITADEPLSLWLYWRDEVPGGPAYRVYPQLVDAQGQVWSQFPYWPTVFKPASSPSEWPPDVYASTAFDLWPLPGTPPGPYTVTLTVFDRETLEQFTAYSGAGVALGPSFALGKVQVSRPKTPPSLDELPGRHVDPAAVVEPLRLVSARLTPDAAKPGDTLSLDVVWLAETKPKVDLWARLWLTPPAGEATDLGIIPLVREDFPTTRWQADDRWLGRHRIRLPARLEQGKHRLEVQLCRQGSGRLLYTSPSPRDS